MTMIRSHSLALQVVVLDQGKVVECDSPAALIADPRSDAVKMFLVAIGVCVEEASSWRTAFWVCLLEYDPWAYYVLQTALMRDCEHTGPCLREWCGHTRRVAKSRHEEGKSSVIVVLMSRGRF